MIDDILPDGVVSVTARDLGLDDDRAVRELWPAEAEAVAKASPKRRAEFGAVRHCAREALDRMGRPPAAILRGGRGMPLWPDGVVGSMTHCDGYRAAAVADAAEFRSVGMDVERHTPLPDGVLDSVSLPDERERIRALAAVESRVHWDTLLFTAKETTYKVWFPLTRRWLGFADARITFAADVATDEEVTGWWRSEILVDPGTVDGRGDLTSVEGRWIVRGDHVASAAAPAAVEATRRGGEGR